MAVNSSGRTDCSSTHTVLTDDFNSGVVNFTDTGLVSTGPAGHYNRYTCINWKFKLSRDIVNQTMNDWPVTISLTSRINGTPTGLLFRGALNRQDSEV